jgi:AcrR family transcriptional regulator
VHVSTATTRRPRLNRAQQQAATRAALIDAAARVFAERGFAGASVEAIAEEAGYTRGAFYSNFGSKEELFADLLQEQVYSRYREMAERSARGTERLTMRELGERLAGIQAQRGGPSLFRLWLELIAHAGRDSRFRKLAARFWRGNRRRSAEAIAAGFEAAGQAPPLDPKLLATAMIALDIGLAIQHFVDPREVPASAYPDLYEFLFGPHDPPRALSP